MEHEKDSQIIYVKDLLFAILYRWRAILVCAVVFALLLGAFSLVRQNRAISSAPSLEVLQQQRDDYLLKKDEFEKSLTELEAFKSNLTMYIHNAPLMQIDPYHAYVAQTTLSISIPPVEADQEKSVLSGILIAYRDILQDARIYADLAQQLGVDSRYLPELVTIPERDASLRSLRVLVSYPTEEGARQILDTLIETVHASVSRVEAVHGAHTLDVLSGTVRPQIDNRFNDQQKAAKQRLTDLNNQITTAQAELDALSAPGAAATFSGKQVVLFSLIGLFLGCFAAAAVIFVAHLASSKVYSARTLRGATGLQVLGCIPGASRQCFIDRWLRKLEGRMVDPAHLESVVANLRNYCGNQKLLLVTEEPEAVQVLTAAMVQAGIQILSSGSLIYSAATLTALPQCEGAVLAVKCGSSRYVDVLQSMERILDQKKALLGCVVIDG